MKTIEVDDALYHYIASQTLHIGESASAILRRLLDLSVEVESDMATVPATEDEPAVVELEAAEPLISPTERDTPDALLSLMENDGLNQFDSSIERLIHVLGVLYQIDADGFQRAADIRGRKRSYFALTEEALLATGKTTKPKPVTGTPFWIVSNTNTGRKRNILAQLMHSMGFDEAATLALCEKI